MAFFTQDYLDFFKDLAGNNHRDWFHENKKRYVVSVKEPFAAFIQKIIELTAKDNPAIKIQPKDAIFRINRDIRFSKDKTPYKLNCSAVVSSGGRKDKTNPGIYLEASPEDFRIYSGVYMPNKEQLYDVRDYIMNNAKKFRGIITEKDFVSKFDEIRGEKNKIISKEFKEAAEKEPLLFNKQFYIYRKFEAETILRDDLDELVMEHWFTAKPFMQFFHKALN